MCEGAYSGRVLEGWLPGRGAGTNSYSIVGISSLDEGKKGYQKKVTCIKAAKHERAGSTLRTVKRLTRKMSVWGVTR